MDKNIIKRYLTVLNNQTFSPDSSESLDRCEEQIFLCKKYLEEEINESKLIEELEDCGCPNSFVDYTDEEMDKFIDNACKENDCKKCWKLFLENVFSVNKVTTEEIGLIGINSITDENTSNKDLINMKQLHNKGINGKDVVVAVIDTGCQKDHPMLKDKIIGGKNFTCEGNADDFSDYNGHGTHVSGIIAGDYDGVAKGCKLLILKVLTSSGNGSLEGVVNAINYAVKQKVDIINMSLGCPSDDKALYSAVKNAVDSNILVCCASGNSGDNNPNTDENDYPGTYNEVISVGAMSESKQVSKFSNSNRFVDIVAPGENITSTYIGEGLKSLSGTSMACPCVSGALALLIEWSTIEFGRRLSEMELYGLLVKNTISIENTDRRLQGQGRLEFNIEK